MTSQALANQVVSTRERLRVALNSFGCMPKTYDVGTRREPMLSVVDGLGDGRHYSVRWIEAIASVCWSSGRWNEAEVDCLRSDVPLSETTLDALEKRVTEMAEEARAEDFSEGE